MSKILKGLGGMSECQKSEFWSDGMSEWLGKDAAAVFAIGCDLLEDKVKEEFRQLMVMPKESHVGEIASSTLAYDLPPQFLPRYDYEFVYAMYCSLRRLAKLSRNGDVFKARNVLDEIVIYLAEKEAESYLELKGVDVEEEARDWTGSILGDLDVETCLFSGIFATKNNMYHFEHWMDGFYEDRETRKLYELGLLAHGVNYDFRKNDNKENS